MGGKKWEGDEGAEGLAGLHGGRGEVIYGRITRIPQTPCPFRYGGASGLQTEPGRSRLGRHTLSRIWSRAYVGRAHTGQNKPLGGWYAGVSRYGRNTNTTTNLKPNGQFQHLLLLSSFLLSLLLALSLSLFTLALFLRLLSRSHSRLSFASLCFND